MTINLSLSKFNACIYFARTLAHSFTTHSFPIVISNKYSHQRGFLSSFSLSQVSIQIIENEQKVRYRQRPQTINTWIIRVAVVSHRLRIRTIWRIGWTTPAMAPPPIWHTSAVWTNGWMRQSKSRQNHRFSPHRRSFWTRIVRPL